MDRLLQHRAIDEAIVFRSDGSSRDASSGDLWGRVFCNRAPATFKHFQMFCQPRRFRPTVFELGFQSFQYGPVGIAVEFDDASDCRHGVFDLIIGIGFVKIKRHGGRSTSDLIGFRPIPD